MERRQTERANWVGGHARKSKESSLGRSCALYSRFLAGFGDVENSFFFFYVALGRLGRQGRSEKAVRELRVEGLCILGSLGLPRAHSINYINNRRKTMCRWPSEFVSDIGAAPVTFAVSRHDIASTPGTEHPSEKRMACPSHGNPRRRRHRLAKLRPRGFERERLCMAVSYVQFVVNDLSVILINNKYTLLF